MWQNKEVYSNAFMLVPSLSQLCESAVISEELRHKESWVMWLPPPMEGKWSASIILMSCSAQIFIYKADLWSESRCVADLFHKAGHPLML